jgi:hypothetical protein
MQGGVLFPFKINKMEVVGLENEMNEFELKCGYPYYRGKFDTFLLHKYGFCKINLGIFKFSRYPEKFHF